MVLVVQVQGTPWPPVNGIELRCRVSFHAWSKRRKTNKNCMSMWTFENWRDKCTDLNDHKFQLCNTLKNDIDWCIHVPCPSQRLDSICSTYQSTKFVLKMSYPWFRRVNDNAVHRLGKIFRLFRSQNGLDNNTTNDRCFDHFLYLLSRWQLICRILHYNGLFIIIVALYPFATTFEHNWLCIWCDIHCRCMNRTIYCQFASTP